MHPNYVAISLLTLSRVCLCGHFDHIDIRIVRNDAPMLLIEANDVNNELNISDVLIANQTLPTLKQGSFRNLPKLKTVKIQHCGLEHIEADAFNNLTSLRMLNLNQNLLRTIPRNVFNNLTITKLLLAANAIATLAPGAFHDIFYLEVLDLGSNHLTQLHPHMFRGTPNLRQINFSFNKLVAVPDDCFRWALSHVVQGHDSLLDLSDNQLTDLRVQAVNDIRHLKRLNLMNNDLEHLDANLFNELQVEIVDLQNNKLNALDNNVLYNLQGSRVINLYGNPWMCGFIRKYTNWCEDLRKVNTIGTDHLTKCKLLD